MLTKWLEGLIIEAARDIEAAQTGIYKFGERIEEALAKAPLRDWEADRWARGVKLGLIKMETYFFRVGAGKNAAFSAFIRNKENKNVGFRREAITQMATYVTLITEYGFSRSQTKFESGWMDVVVLNDRGGVLIYAENKASDKTLEKLCSKLERSYADRVPIVDMDEKTKVHDDPLMKANHIWRNKPRYFWGVSPERSQAYEVLYGAAGFHLARIERVPYSYEIPKTELVI